MISERPDSFLWTVSIAASVAACCPHPPVIPPSPQPALAEGPKAPEHRNRDLHGPPDVEAYIRDLEAQDRVVVQSAKRIVGALHLRGDETVADLGCGPGLVTLEVARALPNGFVYAVDVEPAQLDRVNQHVKESGLETRVVPVLAVTDDPRLPKGTLDLLLIVDAYHHLDDRPRYLHRARERLKTGARVAIVDWHKRVQPKGPPPSHTVAREEVLNEMKEAGFRLLEEPTFLEYQYFLIFGLE